MKKALLLSIVILLIAIVSPAIAQIRDFGLATRNKTGKRISFQ